MAVKSAPAKPAKADKPTPDPNRESYAYNWRTRINLKRGREMTKRG